jgi:YidC/Oxa1 family membrane protein insertase
MDRKSILILVACFVLMLLWPVVVDKIYPPMRVPVKTNTVAGAAAGAQMTGAGSNAPATVSSTPALALTAASLPEAKFVVRTEVPEQLLTISNETAQYIFTSRGGGLKEVRLLHYDETQLNAPTVPPVLAILGDESLQGDGVFKLTPLAGGVRAEKALANGLVVVKTFLPGTNYEMNAAVVFENQSKEALSLPAQQWSVGTATPMGPQDNGYAEGVFWYNGAKSASVTIPFFNTNTSSFLGLFPRTPKSEYLAGENNVAWVSAQNQFFTVGTIPQQPASSLVVRMVDLPPPGAEEIKKNPSSIRSPKGLEATLIYPALRLEPGHSVTNQFTLFTGPKEYQTLARLAARFNNDFDVIMSFGWFGPISKTLLAAMNLIHFGTGLAYGWIIISITIVIKLVFWPLTRASTRSAKRMQALQPQLKALQEKYKDDPQKFTAKQWEFYKENKVNPLSGCLPMLLQVPVFIAFYSMLRSAIELRGASFWWMVDLSKPDTVFHVPVPMHFLGYTDFFLPVNPMPLIMGVTVFFQASMTPMSPGMDPAQQKMMKYMPLMMLFFMYTQPSGLALYWTVSNLLTIVQTKLTRMESAAPKPPGAQPVRATVSAAPQRKKK